MTDDPEFSRRWQRRFVQRGARLDDDAGIAGWTSTGLASRIRQFKRHWQHAAPQGGLWLDLGCGAGTYCRLLDQEGRRVIGVDYAPPSLHKAKQRSPSAIQWVAGDAQALPFCSASFDGVLCFGVIQALGRSDLALAEMRRVVRPGGEVWVDALNFCFAPTRMQEWRRRRAGRPPHLRYETPYAFRNCAEQVGLEPLDWFWLPLVPGRLAWFQGLLESAYVKASMTRLPMVGEAMSHSFILRACRSSTG